MQSRDGGYMFSYREGQVDPKDTRYCGCLMVAILFVAALLCVALAWAIYSLARWLFV